MFGQSGNTSFSGFNTATQTSPFGQSAFGKPITTTSFGSGATPVFGSSNTSLFSSKPTGSTTGGLFVNTTTPPAFRQPTNTQPSFGGFGTTSTNTNLFGSQQNASTNLFGSSTTTPAFGQANKPAGFSFGATTGSNLFGQPQQSTQQTTPFGQSGTTGSTNLFGTTPGFGSTNTTTTGVTGTVVKFTPVITTDSMSKNGISHSISARHNCIASMKEYESKSYEELRYEDYSVGRKGPSTGLFGAPAQPSPFGNTGAGTSTAGTGFGGMTGGFGQTSQSGSIGIFGKPVTRFGTTTTTTTNSFGFNSTPSTNIFGSNTQAKPFGTAAPTPLFPTNNTNQNAGTGFGGINTGSNSGFGSVFGTAQSNQSIGLFNQNKSAFNVPATSTGAGFTGFGQTPSSNAGSIMFGPKTTGNAGFGTAAFGGPATVCSFGTSTGFTPGQNSGTSLFNTSFKPTGQGAGFTFGSTTAPSTGLGTNTGLTLGSGPSLFGQQKPGGLFGSSGANTSFNHSGSFGTSSFGTNSNVGTGIGMGLLGGIGSGGSGGNSGSGGGITTNTAKNSGSVPVHQQILALVSAPFGDSPLLKNLLPASGKAEELLKPTNAASRTLNGPQYKVTANNKSPKVKTRVVTAAQLSKKSLFEGLEEEDPILSEAFQPRANAKRLVLRPKAITNSPTVQSPNGNSQNIGKNADDKEDKTDVTDTTYENNVERIDKENNSRDNNRQLANDRRSSSSWLKSTLPRKSKLPDEESFEGQRSPFSTPSEPTEEPINNTITELRPHANSPNQTSSNANNFSETVLNSSLAEKTSNADLTAQNTDSSEELDESSFYIVSQNDWTDNAAKVTLRRVGYYTNPPLDKLDSYVCGETCIVPNFTVGREGYGNVYFPDSIDVYGLNLDDIVHFRHKEVIIYPDDEKKPPIGQGLNRKAQVTLDRVWPHDKSLHEAITDPHRLAAMNYEAKLRRVSAKHDTRFLEYRPETGSWVFKVDHFSKYGLSDSDEEESSGTSAPSVSDPKKFKAALADETTVGKREALRIKQSLQQRDQTPNVQADTSSVDPSKLGNGSQPGSETSPLLESVLSHGTSAVDQTREKHLPVSPIGDNARILGTDSHKLQLMKASFFDYNDYDDEEIDRDADSMVHKSERTCSLRYIPDVIGRQRETITNRIYSPVLRSNLTIRRVSGLAPYDETISPKAANARLIVEERSRSRSRSRSSADDVEAMHRPSPLYSKAFPEPTVTPLTTVLRYRSEVVPLCESIIDQLRSRSVADTGIQMGRMFRPSWGRGLTLLSLSTQEQATKVQLQNAFEHLGSYVSGRLLNDTTSATIVQRLQILGGSGASTERVQTFKESIEGHLRIQLSNCVMGQEGDCPVFDVAVDTASAALHAHYSLAHELAEQAGADRTTVYAANVWKLCVALWGNLPDINAPTGNAKHHNVVARREAIGEWLQSVVKETVDREIADVTSEEKTILLLLSAFRLEDACEAARKVGDHCLALLMAQLRSGMPTRELIKQQLALWQETDVDENLSIDRLKLFTLLAGEPLISSAHGTINVCETLDWKRAFAMHLWYLSPPTASLRDALELYEASFDPTTADVYAASPKPEYKEEDYDLEVTNGRPIHDLCFHLLKLHCTGDHSLGELLNPSTHTADPLDYRLSWLMQQLLVALGYSHLSEDVAALTHTNFATQLEAYGLWQWAIFILLHLRDAGRRQSAVMDLLHRHVEVDELPAYIEREQFLREELGIPSTWIHRAKAVKSYVCKRYGEAAWYYIQAEHWNTAHEIIIDHLAADAIINENYEYLKTLLCPLVPAECSDTISGWQYQGQLLWDYMDITMDIENLLRTADPRGISYKLELLKPRLTGLCFKINQFPCPTAKHRLCQAEIAKRTLHLARNLLVLQSNENRSAAKMMVQLVSQLPLPEDYAQQELRPIVNIRVNEMISQAV